MGFEDTITHEITPGYTIFIEGLKTLENVELSMSNVDGNDVWAWYGTDDFGSPGTPIYFGSTYDGDQFIPVSGNGKTWKDFTYIKMTALQGSVLLSGYGFFPSAESS